MINRRCYLGTHYVCVKFIGYNLIFSYCRHVCSSITTDISNTPRSYVYDLTPNESSCVQLQ